MPATHLASRSPSPCAKRLKTEHVHTAASHSQTDWTRLPVHYGKGLHLAPMVRSGTLPTRLLALEAGAQLVWGPETVDRAIIGCERAVDLSNGVINFSKSGRTIFSIHPVERPRLIFQIGSSSPSLAAEAAKIVCHDVAGIDLNCGCPKPFSTHSGMGARLLETPDTLCAILCAIRESIPPEVPVSCKIRLLPSQEATLSLVKQIVGTGAIRCLTVHCRTPPMRDRDRALIGRLRDIVEAVGSEVAVVENGDCVGWQDAERIRKETGVKAVMIARAAEANPTCFGGKCVADAGTAVADAETIVIPRYLRLARHLNNPWPNTKFCVTQFSSPRPLVGKEGRQKWKAALSGSKSYESLTSAYGQETDWLDGGLEVLDGIARCLMQRIDEEGSPPEVRPRFSGDGDSRDYDVRDVRSAPSGCTGDFLLAPEQMSLTDPVA